MITVSTLILKFYGEQNDDSPGMILALLKDEPVGSYLGLESLDRIF